MRIYVTGSGGILGRHVLAWLDRLCPEADVIRNTADLTDGDATQKALHDCGPLDLVLHLAALVPVAEVKADPARAYAVNVAGTANLCAAMTSKRMLYCSSGHVYAPSAERLAETAPTIPVSVYGQTKLMGEDTARFFAQTKGVSLCCGRVFSIHDPAQTGSYLRPTISRRLTTEDLSKPFELYGAESLRDFLTAKEAAQRLVKLALTEAEGEVNIGAGCGTKVAEFVQSLSSVTLDIHPKGHADILVADTSRLRAILGDLDG
ncbi:UDP-glucose 4-epimerase [Candidatus Rhodobacter oscarellae]|uniref:UDP-glucose 4-epimerase n=1 Tax=Candidatus Rhodobacter oscarellae TaxID=1675527 RepID=A0A0J9GV09_9RHOB|nr:NAD(P)-dependent oxidoreductase [Candidatus Rhodobacter lobularis]KMW57413.1 UDP-glucose 4-epimerase [Candidatus Rhodobacter lobularis]